MPFVRSAFGFEEDEMDSAGFESVGGAFDAVVEALLFGTDAEHVGRKKK